MTQDSGQCFSLEHGGGFSQPLDFRQLRLHMQCVHLRHIIGMELLIPERSLQSWLTCSRILSLPDGVMLKGLV